MTPALLAVGAPLALLFLLWALLARFWPDDESDTTLRQEAAEVIGLARGLLAFAWWALSALPRMILAARDARKAVTR